MHSYNTNKEEIYSTHTFTLPFVWEGTGAHQKTMKDFSALFDNAKDEWKCTDLNRDLNWDDLVDKVNYKELQYFHPFVKNAIYGNAQQGIQDNDPVIVKNYEFMPDKIHNRAYYIIEKELCTEDDNGHAIESKALKYSLRINAIRLKVFNTGIALFIIECENIIFDGAKGIQHTLEAVKNINDYGRRITLPFIPNKYYQSICADKLSISFNGMDGDVILEENFRDRIDRINGYSQADEDIDETQDILPHIPYFVKTILNYGKENSEKTITLQEKSQSDSCFYIYPILDDRMHVMSYIVDANESKKFVQVYNNDLQATAYEEASKSLYELAFIDRSTDCTCQNKKMREELLNEHLYLRWVDYGTIYSITNQGIIGLVNFDLEHLRESFLTQYLQIAYLAMAQKATLVHFQNEAATISAGIEKKGKSIEHKQIQKLMDLQERFIAFKTQILFKEVTPQEQGIEIYDMIQKSMLINREMESLESCMSSLRDAADTNLDYMFNTVGVRVAAVAIIISAVEPVLNSIISGLLGADGNSALRSWWELHIGIASIILGAIAWLYFWCKFRRNKK